MKNLILRTLLACSMVAGVVAAAMLASCRSAATDGKPVAVATIFAYYDALRAIGGDDVHSVILLPPRQSPHDYSPTVQDRAVVARASLIVKNGLQIDLWADKLAAENKSAIVVDVSEVVKANGIAPLDTQEVSVTSGPTRPAHGEDVSAGNPHIWLDPRVQAMAAEAIRDALIKMDPAHKAGYEARAAAYIAQLRQLDQDFAQAARGFRQKEFIGFHSAYDYLANRYGLKQVAAVEEMPGEAGPNAVQLGNIIKLIRDKHIHVIFTENAMPAKAADRIIEETGVKTGILQPLETYYSIDDTYASLMRQNLAELKKALD